MTSRTMFFGSIMISAIAAAGPVPFPKNGPIPKLKVFPTITIVVTDGKSPIAPDKQGTYLINGLAQVTIASPTKDQNFAPPKDLTVRMYVSYNCHWGIGAIQHNDTLSLPDKIIGTAIWPTKLQAEVTVAHQYSWKVPCPKYKAPNGTEVAGGATAYWTTVTAKATTANGFKKEVTLKFLQPNGF